jgi:putative copper resistance protein D
VTTLFDIFGYLSVVLHGLELVAQSVLIGSVSYTLWIAVPLESESRALDRGRRLIVAAALAVAVLSIASTALNAAVLFSTLDTSVAEILGAEFVLAGAVKVLGTLLIAAATMLARGGAWVGTAMGAGAAMVLGGAIATSHAVARLGSSGLLLVATAMHELGAALWLGGLPCLWLALGRTDEAQKARAIAMRYSELAIAGVALIAAGAVAFALVYIGSLDGAYGTAYGAMAVTKSILFGMLLLLGLANFRAVRRFMIDSEAQHRTRRFIEVEMGLGFALLMAAASITSLPPAVDLVDDRLTASDIAGRFTAQWPRLDSPEHAGLAIPALQARLDAQAMATQTTRPKAFVPGGGELPPRNAEDVAWSEYNHHWAGLLVALMGLAALAGRSGLVPWARHWPLLFLLLAAFLFLRADPEVSPLGSIGLIESLRDPEVAQHRFFEVLIVGFALFEWGVSTGRIAQPSLRRVFPVLVALGGTLLLTHSHSLGNVKQEMLIELTHLPIAVLGITAGWARWLEIEAPAQEGRCAGWVWPACFVLIGLLLLLYREA